MKKATNADMGNIRGGIKLCVCVCVIQEFGFGSTEFEMLVRHSDGDSSIEN